MGIQIRRGDPAKDRDVILGVLSRNLPAAADVRRFDWLYLGNPAGPACVWLALDETGSTIGTSAAHLRQVQVGNDLLTVLNLSDFAIDAKFRSVGPALKLLRATIEPVMSGEYPFAYDHPSRAMQAVHKRLGGIDLGSVTRFIKPLSWGPILENRWGRNPATRLAGGVVDIASRLKGWTRTNRELQIARYDRPLTEEFETLALKVRLQQRPVAGLLTADFMNWRFMQHPIWPHSVTAARRGNELVGFCVAKLTSDSAWAIVEIVALDQDTTLSLLQNVVKQARRANIERINAPVLENSPLAQWLVRVGFVEREKNVGPTVFVSKSANVDSRISDRDSWWMVEGDRDV